MSAALTDRLVAVTLATPTLMLDLATTRRLFLFADVAGVLEALTAAATTASGHRPHGGTDPAVHRDHAGRPARQRAPAYSAAGTLLATVNSGPNTGVDCGPRTPVEVTLPEATALLACVARASLDALDHT
ncbi:MAG: hypothetical protein V9E98_15140 [Candidatus Nanopelagicales bacterium]